MELGGKVILVVALGFGTAKAEPVGSVTVLVYDYANVPGAQLVEAETFAARSYRAAGIELIWIECATSDDGSELFHACERANDGHRLYLNITSKRVADIRGPRKFDDAFGLAYQTYAAILYPRIEEMAHVWGIPEYLILGRTMAHELGHLLLGANSHAPSGLMRPRFGWRDLSLESAQFLFDPKQAAELRRLVQSGQPVAAR